MFAQNYHIAMKYVAPIRQELAIRTIFNILGPLTPVCAYFLLDAGLSGGGSGKALCLDDLAHITPPGPSRPWFLAGGLGPCNLSQTLAAVAAFACAPCGVDLNSALENSPGVKDHTLTREALTIVNKEKHS